MKELHKPKREKIRSIFNRLLWDDLNALQDSKFRMLEEILLDGEGNMVECFSAIAVALIKVRTFKQMGLAWFYYRT